MKIETPNILKVVLLGDGAVGKTSLRLRYMGLGFAQSYMMTIGADFAVKSLDTASGKQIKLQIWDLAGQPHFSKVRSLFYNGTGAAILVYDCTRLNTFQNIDNWMEELLKNVKTPIPIILIANKTDLRGVVDFSVTKEEGYYLAQKIAKKYFNKKNTVGYIETSAKSGDNVANAFSLLVE